MSKSTHQESQEEIFTCTNCNKQFNLSFETPWKLNGNVSQGNDKVEIHNSPLCELCASELAEMEECV